MAANIDIDYDENVTLTLGALAGLDVIAQNSKIDSSRENGFFLIRSTILAEVQAKTASEGPIVWGIAIGVAQGDIEQALEADPQSAFGLRLKNPNTYIKPLGLIAFGDTAKNLTPDSNPIVISPKWTVAEGHNLSYWAYNMNASALTTGTLIRIFAEHMGRDLRD